MDRFVDFKFDFIIKWSTQNVKQLFQIKDKNPQQACNIYKGVCTFGENYIINITY